MFENDHFQNCVYFRWVFFSAETTCTADVLHSYLVFSIYLAKKKQIYTMYISVNHFMYFCQRYNELTYIVVTSIK